MNHLGWLLALLLAFASGVVLPLAPAAAAQAADPRSGLSLVALLPPASAIPVANAETVDGTQDLFTVAATFPDAALAMRNLQQWGFEANAWRDYVSAWWEDPYLPNRAEVSLHQFRSEAGAVAALPVYAAARAAALGLATSGKSPAGTNSILLSGAVDGGNEDTIYVAAGGILARVTVISPAGDPYPYAKKIARTLVKTIAAPAVSAAPAAPAASAPAASAPAPVGGNIAIPVGGNTTVPATSGNVAISNPPAAPAAPADSPLRRVLDELRDREFTIETVGEDICCVTFAEETTLGMAGEVGTLYFRAKASGYISHLTPSLRYTVFETTEAAATAWDAWIGDRKEYLPYKEFENPAPGGPPVVIFTATPNNDTATATGFLLAGNVIVTASVRSAEWQALLPSIAQRNTNSLLLAGYRHLIALFGE